MFPFGETSRFPPCYNKVARGAIKRQLLFALSSKPRRKVARPRCSRTGLPKRAGQRDNAEDPRQVKLRQTKDATPPEKIAPSVCLPTGSRATLL
jgi:hypothetical protein